MKKVIKIIGIIILIPILLIALLFIKAAFTPMVPNDYEKTVKTGGDIEAKYISHGKYEVSYYEKKTDEKFKKYEVYYPKELENKNKKYPVVVFVNGTGVKGSKYKALFKHLSSWGFIVLGNEEEESWNGIASEKSLAFILQENENKDSIFYNKVDIDNIGVSGHSQGGAGVFTTISEHEHSNMYKAAVALSPANEELAESLEWHYDASKTNIPIMIIAGTTGEFEIETVIPFEKLESLYSHINSKKLMMRKTGMEHGQTLYAADGYVTAWFMWQLQGDEEASKAFVGDNPEILENKLYQDQKTDLGEN